MAVTNGVLPQIPGGFSTTVLQLLCPPCAAVLCAPSITHVLIQTVKVLFLKTDV